MTGAEVGPLLGDIMANLGVIALVSVGIGATAPKWPRAWLSRDVGPLRLTRWETAERYRRSRLSRLARSLPEAGAALGGVSKRSHPRRTRIEILAYLVETRRGEWVHWLAMLALGPMLAYNPWWMWVSFLFAVAMVNGVFIVILRGSRVWAYSRLAQLDGVAPSVEPSDA